MSIRLLIGLTGGLMALVASGGSPAAGAAVDAGAGTRFGKGTGPAPAVEYQPVPYKPKEDMTSEEVSRKREQDYVRLQSFRQAVQAGEDPVAFAVRGLSDAHPFIVLASLDVLVRHPFDPRVEPALTKLAMQETTHEGPRRDVDLAREYLRRVRGRKAYALLLEGASTPTDKVKRIRQVFADHPDWMRKRPPSDAWPVIDALLEGAMVEGGADCVDLVVQRRWWDYEWLKKYADAFVAHFKKLGHEVVVADEHLLQGLILTGHRNRIPLMEDWLQKTTAEEGIERLVEWLGRLDGGQERLLQYIQSDRDLIRQHAVRKLAYAYENDESVRALTALAEARRRAKAPAKELEDYAYYIQHLKKAIVDNKEAQLPKE